jgi:hypothetical protein
MRSTTPLLVALLLLVAPALSHAQLIDWLGANAITGDSDVFTTGTYVDAFQAATGTFNGKPDSTQTVNGVAFNINDTYAFTDGTFSLTGDVADGTDGNYPSVGSTAYQDVLADCAYTANGTPVTVTMNGLTAGKEYEIEVWNSTPYDDTILTGSTSGDIQSLDIGQYTLGTFTAGATNSFTFGNGPSRSGVGTIDALEIRQIPEPSTYALMGLGLLAIAVVSRRGFRAA